MLDAQAGALDERKRIAGLVVAAESNGDLSHRRWSVSNTRLVNFFALRAKPCQCLGSKVGVFIDCRVRLR